MTINIKKNFTIKLLNYKELKIALERLTRFSSPFDKIERVHREILIKHTIEPKINSKKFRELDFYKINQIFQHIWNDSVVALGGKNDDKYALNLYLAYEERKTFSAENFFKNIDLKEKSFIDYKMSDPPNIRGCLELLAQNNDLSDNARRLLDITKIIDKEELTSRHPELVSGSVIKKLEKLYSKAVNYRKENGSLFPIELILLVEGITEEILLPVFSEFAGINFKKSGIKIISSGGKNQVLRLYKKLSQEVNLPIFMLFDADAAEEVEFIKNSLREIDDIYIISKGEFEDILPDKLICKAVNVHYRLTGKINLSEIEDSQKKSHTLMELWKEKGFGEFKKAEFARIVADNISKKSDLSEELELIFSKIKNKLD